MPMYHQSRKTSFSQAMDQETFILILLGLLMLLLFLIGVIYILWKNLNQVKLRRKRNESESSTVPARTSSVKPDLVPNVEEHPEVSLRRSNSEPNGRRSNQEYPIIRLSENIHSKGSSSSSNRNSNNTRRFKLAGPRINEFVSMFEGDLPHGRLSNNSKVSGDTLFEDPHKFFP